MDDGNCTLETCGYDSPDPGESAHNYDPDADIDDGSCIYGPDIISIYDAPNDEGGQVYLNWSANSLDQTPNQVITRYSVWRYLPDENRGWQFLEYVDAYYFETYGVVAPTHGDSTSVGVPWTTYKVLAHTEDQWTFYPSEPDSGYSVDNLAPDLIAELQSEVIDTDVFLNWEESTAADLSHYNIYLNGTYLTLTEQVDLFHESPPYAQDLNYRVSAVDVHENESILSEPTHQFILLSGDVNLDASVDVMDIVVLVDVIINGIPLNDIQFIAADMNSDNYLNVIDIVMIVDEIIGESLSRTEGMEEISLLYGNGIFTLEFKSVMAGIQCEVSGDYEINNVHLSEGWKLHENGSTLLLFAQDGSDINTNRPFDYVGELKVISCIATDWFFEPFMVDVVELPKSYSLNHAYPNPFNPVTRINFELPVDSHISMTIYNLQGRLITTLSDEIKSAGYHTITWNASQQASGIYFVKMYARDADMATIGMMTIESYLQTHKLMLVK